MERPSLDLGGQTDTTSPKPSIKFIEISTNDDLSVLSKVRVNLKYGQSLSLFEYLCVPRLGGKHISQSQGPRPRIRTSSGIDNSKPD